MLKIKDSIDLKELEKFGFKKQNNIFYREFKIDDDLFSVELNRITLEINVSVITDINKFMNNMKAYKVIDDLLDDLIKAGIVYENI